jgi:hypothetical protein
MKPEKQVFQRQKFPVHGRDQFPQIRVRDPQPDTTESVTVLERMPYSFFVSRSQPAVFVDVIHD